MRPPARRKLAVKLALALVIGAVGVLTPVPELVDEAAMATETRRPFAAEATTTSTAATTATSATTAAPATSAEPATTVSTSTTVASPGPTDSSPPTTEAPPPAGGARVTATEDTRTFSLIGVILAAQPTGPVRVRTALDGGEWGAVAAARVRRRVGASARSRGAGPA